MPVVKLTLPFIKTLPSPERRTTYWDMSLPCFGLRVSPSGAKTFIIKYRNQHNKIRWYKIGNCPPMTLEKARTEAREQLQNVSHRKDPAKDKEDAKNAKTVAELCDLYLAEGVNHKKQSTITIDRGRIETHIKPLIGKEPVASLTQGQVIAFMNDIIKGDKIRRASKSGKPRGVSRVSGGPTAASRSVQLLGAIMEFAIRHHIIKENPAHNIELPKANRREVFLTEGEIRALGRILEHPHWRDLHKAHCDIIKLLLLTGCRRREITNMQWSEVDFTNQVFRFHDTKTGPQNRIFGKGALHLLRELEKNKTSDWVFPSIRGNGPITNPLKPLKAMLHTKDDDGKLILDKPDLTIHALRHSFASMGAQMGIHEDIIGLILGHKRHSVTGIYIHTVDNTLVNVADRISLKIESALAGTQENARKIIKVEKWV